ncbi:MAG: carbon-nitrogen hydrolase family protein [Burkholderiales bacterium]|nr:carbon-nitrogen hydrolase family protein [Burkholderiales bacterium]
MKIAAIQMVSGVDLDRNMEAAYQLLCQAKQRGATLAALPEYWPIMGRRDGDKVVCAEEPGSGRLQTFLSQTARELAMTIVGGTIPLKSQVADKIYNTCLVFDAQGQALGRYDKIHLFGFHQGQESYQESTTITPGDQVVCVDTEVGKIGLGICYDLRFPELFRQMGNQCYVLAAAQGGTHENGRRTWGHSMLIDPWGKVLECLDEGAGVICAELDVAAMAIIRDNLPALSHRKFI